MLPLLHIGLGPLGQRVVADFHARGLGRVVAAVDPAADIVGRKLCDVIEGGDGIDADVVVRGSLDEITDWTSIRAALVTTCSDLELCMDTLRPLLRRGLAVVSTCEELSWPWLRHPILAQELHELCIRFGGKVLGCGVNPGFLMDALPVAVSTLGHRVNKVRIERVQDAATRRIPFQRKIGAALTLDEFAQRVADGSLRHVGLGESLHFVAHSLGMQVERWDESIDPVVSNRTIECGLGTIEAGQTSGVRQVARAFVAGEVAVELIFHAAIGTADPHDTITIEGDPPLKLTFEGGVHGDSATSAVVLNSIRSLLGAAPGLHTMASLPLRGAATPDRF